MYAQYPEEKVPNMYICYGPGGRNWEKHTQYVHVLWPV